MHIKYQIMLKRDISFKHVILHFESLMHIQENHTNQQNIFRKSKACTSQDKKTLSLVIPTYMSHNSTLSQDNSIIKL